MGKLTKAIKWLCIVGVLGGSVAASARWAPSIYTRWFDKHGAVAKQDDVRFATVQRADLRITVVEDGKLRAIKNYFVYPELRGQSRITFLVPEGSMAKKGDKLVEFEKKPLQEVLQTRTTDLEGAKREVSIKEEAVRIQRPTTRSAVAMANTKLGEADVALKTYRDLEGPKKLNEFETAINDTRGKLTTATKSLTEAQNQMKDQLFIEDDQRKILERDARNAKEIVDSLKKAIDTTMLQRKIFRRYDYPQNLKSKGQAWENAKLEVEKAVVAAKSEMSQKEQELAKINDMIARLTREIADLNEQIAKCTLTAPADGMVLYGDPTNPNRYYYNGETQIRVGMEWYGSNTIVTIPDLSAFEVSLAIGEEYRGKLQVGCKAAVTVEAVPGLTLDAELKTITNLARNRVPWDQSSPKVFDATVVPKKSDPRMVSGMTTRIEIVAEVVPKALTVPIEAVFNEDGKPVCYVRHNGAIDRRPIKPGKSNDHLVEILEGLSEGEQVELLPAQRSTTGKPAQPEKKS